MRFLRCLRNIFSNVSLSFSFLFLSGIYIQYTRFLSAKKINTEHFFGLCPDIWLIFDNNGKPSICSHFRLCRKNIFSASFVDFFCNLSILRKKGVILMKVKYIFLIMLLLILAVCLTTCASYNTSDKDWPTYDSMSTAVNISIFSNKSSIYPGCKERSSLDDDGFFVLHCHRNSIHLFHASHIIPQMNLAASSVLFLS